MLAVVIALHVFGVITWVGGLLTLASLLARVPEEVGVAKERIIVVTRRLGLGVHLGAAITIVLGIALIFMEPGVIKQGWLHLKLTLVVILLYFHYRFFSRAAQLENDPSRATRGEFMMIHGIVSLLLVGILLLVMLKPFSG
ncbi:MAG TPA: CopD family protein [Candidatus Binataceae bacterium]|nr:CopD family protein [Candidatus Binataceae bacterium]